MTYSWQATGQGADQLTYRASLNGGAEFDGECVDVNHMLFLNYPHPILLQPLLLTPST